MNRRCMRSSAGGWLLAALLMGGRVDAAEPWQGLPPTPALPATRSSGLAAVNGVKLFYARFGKGRPVLLLHGGLGNSDYWGNVIPPLVAGGFEVIVMDSRGHGRSTRSDAPFSYQLMADDVVGLLDHLQLPRVDLVGWSDGGIIGIDLAIRRPERLNSMAIYGSNSDLTGTRHDFDRSPVFAQYLERVRGEYGRLSPTPHDFERFLSQIETMWGSQPRYSRLELARIRTPTLVFDGAHDEAIARPHTEFLAHAIPGASLVVLDDVSHFGMVQAPGEFARTIIHFLLVHPAMPAASNQPPEGSK